MDAIHSGDQHDYSTSTLTVVAPAWEIVTFAAPDGNTPQPGQTTDLALTLRNIGSVASAGATVNLTLLTIDGASLGTGSASLAACPVGEIVKSVSSSAVPSTR